MKKLMIEANVDNLYEVLNFVNEYLRLHNCPPEPENQIDIAVEEIFVNIAKYAYQTGDGNVAIFISAVDDEISVRFEDTGKPYNPLEQAAPDLDKPILERKIGGLGIFFVKQLMDKVEYMYVENKNVLVITKIFNTNSQSIS